MMHSMQYARVGQTADSILASAKADQDAIMAEFPPPGVASRPEIMTWQGKLKSMGFLQPLSNGRFMTGYEGPRTKAATRAFEQAAGGAVAFRGNGLYKPSYDAIADTRLRTGKFPPPQGLPVLPGTTNGGGGGFIQMFPTRADGSVVRPDGTVIPPAGAPAGPVAAPAPTAPAAEAPIAASGSSMTVPLIVGGVVLAAGLTWAAVRYSNRQRR